MISTDGSTTCLPDGVLAKDSEFTEETGLALAGSFTTLAPVKQAGGKIVHAFAVDVGAPE
jgi:predicted NUDIX family NTP pyrophosphohydrolase